MFRSTNVWRQHWHLGRYLTISNPYGHGYLIQFLRGWTSINFSFGSPGVWHALTHPILRSWDPETRFWTAHLEGHGCLLQGLHGQRGAAALVRHELALKATQSDATRRREARHCAAAEARSFTAVRFIKGRWSLRITLGVKAYWFIKPVIIYNYTSLLICKCNFQQWADSITYDHNQSLYIRPQGVGDLVTQKQYVVKSAIPLSLLDFVFPI